MGQGTGHDTARDALGITEMLARFDDLHEKLEALLAHARPAYRTYNLREAAEILGVKQSRVKQLIDEGLLWRVQGLDGAQKAYRIPAAAIEELLRRPS